MQDNTEESYRQPCSKCGAEFLAKVVIIPGLDTQLAMKVCTACVSKNQSQLVAAASTERAKKSKEYWDSHCPVEFRTTAEGGETDLDRLRREQPLYEQCMSWKYKKRGLLLLGDTGVGKTRIAWRIIRREFDAERRFKAMKAHRFGFEAVEHQMKGGLTPWFNPLVRTPLLFIDDFGKGRFTEAVESHWFALIDERTELGLPIIVTTNSNGDELEERMSPDRGPAMIRRLRDYCDTIDFAR